VIEIEPVDGKSVQWLRIAYSVDDLRKARVTADYLLDVSVSLDTAKQAIKTAQNIIQELNAIYNAFMQRVLNSLVLIYGSKTI